MEELSKTSELKKLLEPSDRMALVNYNKKKINSALFTNKLREIGISFDSEEVSDALTEFSRFIPEGIIEKELEKLTLYKLYDSAPLSKKDFFNILSLDYEVNELSLAVALVERNVIELEKNINLFFSSGKSADSILQFIYAYFNKVSLIKLFGSNSFEAKKEYPFLFYNDLEKAKIQAKKWSTEQLNNATDSIALSNLKLRQYSSLFQRSILAHCLFKLMEL